MSLSGFFSLLMAASVGAPDGSGRPAKRPEELGVQANIVFLYYKDTERAARFYEEVLGLRLVVTQSIARIYQVSPTSFVGVVDEAKGLHRASEQKPVTLSFVTDQIDAWYQYLLSQGVKMRSELRDSPNHPIRGFVAYDPEGYFLEFEKFLDHPQNREMLGALKKR